jgi:hypothetical protein|tara:strand:+ start:254 stop:436 length:183 start_codon:yes stop_codon:yes gene_type:complete
MTYINIIEPLSVIFVSFTLGIFVTALFFIYMTSTEKSNLEKNIEEFDKKINKFESKRKHK